MARPAFKKVWTQYVPWPIERSTYVLFSSVALLVLFVYWQPVGGVIWSINNELVRNLLWVLFFSGCGIVLASSFMINHFDLFGLRQVWLYFKGQEYTHLTFREPGLYKVVRHPLYVGWFLVFWATPTMTATHLLFAVITTVYIVMAVRLEEHDLQTFLGNAYTDYMQRVPRFFPGFSKKP